MASLGLQRGQARHFQFGANPRSDFRLLEVNEELLAEIVKDGCVSLCQLPQLSAPGLECKTVVE
jgi:hypothetical protein